LKNNRFEAPVPDRTKVYTVVLQEYQLLKAIG